MDAPIINREDTAMSIADQNLVDELSTGAVTMPKIGRIIAAIYVQIDRQGRVTDAHGHQLDRLETNAIEQKVVNEATLAQTTRTNGRVDKLEVITTNTVSCPGKCITLAEDLEKEVVRAKSQEERLARLEEPIRVRGAIWHGVVSSFTGVSAVLAVIFGLLSVPGVSDRLFAGRDREITQVVEEELARQKLSAVPAPTPAPHNP